MLLAFLKLGDIGTRSLFILIILYSLPVQKSGQFGLLITILAFWSFFCGFERYIDIQRRLVGQPDSGLDLTILDNLRFYSFNLLLAFPVVAVLLTHWAGLNYMVVALVPIIAFAEHQSAEVYRYALIVRRYRNLLWIVLVKGLVLLAVVCSLMFLFNESLTLNTIIMVWAAISAVFLLISIGYFIRLAENLHFNQLPPFWAGLSSHFRASRVHFWIGLLALLSLQADRLIVGSLLSLEQTGLYFRHVYLATFVYNVATVLSYNRILLTVYQEIQTGSFYKAKKIIRAEKWKVIPFGAILVCGIALSRFDVYFDASPFQSLIPSVLAGLLLALNLRILADYNAIILNAFHWERYIFRSQGISLLVSAILNIFMTSIYGIKGTVVTILVGVVLYLFATSFYVRKCYELQDASQ